MTDIPALVVTLLFESVAMGILQQDLYPYPYLFPLEDQLLCQTDDGWSSDIMFNFKFFGNNYTAVYVHANGLLTFTDEGAWSVPKPFPLSIPMIAVFWMDIITTTTGQIWYRITNDSDILIRAQTDIANYYDNQTTFQPTSVFTATWLEVPYYGAEGDDADKRNTFQVVLMTDGDKSFTMFHYQKIEWAGYPGDYKRKAQVGFNAGNNTTSYILSNTDHGDIINLERRSNTGVPGKFIFRVDGNGSIPAGDEIIAGT
ncbi:sushi, nidogen and EGF-like domain-containing protein 1 isoform X2 [Argopecten irradians]|uniref:sushi, nidogen and EGF-like domain-containing protein 1 isoform X2 n=1 Tax=Argopecten irradians TaxID=31199 RepID=UPI0037169B82